MRTRGERRELNRRKWNSLLKRIYKDPTWGFVSDRNGLTYIRTFDDLKNSHIGKLMKSTGTLSHNQWVYSGPWAEKEYRRRDIANKRIPKEQMEEAEESMDMFAFESYCVNCDKFETDDCPFRGKVYDATKWKTIGCKCFMD